MSGFQSFSLSAFILPDVGGYTLRTFWANCVIPQLMEDGFRQSVSDVGPRCIERTASSPQPSPPEEEREASSGTRLH